MVLLPHLEDYFPKVTVIPYSAHARFNKMFQTLQKALNIYDSVRFKLLLFCVCAFSWQLIFQLKSAFPIYTHCHISITWCLKTFACQWKERICCFDQLILYCSCTAKRMKICSQGWYWYHIIYIVHRQLDSTVFFCTVINNPITGTRIFEAHHVTESAKKLLYRWARIMLQAGPQMKGFETQPGEHFPIFT